MATADVTLQAMRTVDSYRSQQGLPQRWYDDRWAISPETEFGLFQEPRFQELLDRCRDAQNRATASASRLKIIDRIQAFAQFLQSFARPAAVIIGLLFAFPLTLMFDLGRLSDIVQDRSVSTIAFHCEFLAILLVLGVRLTFFYFGPYDSLFWWRREIEDSRRTLFYEVLLSAKKSTLPEQLEIFRRFYLEPNVEYFRRRAAQQKHLSGSSRKQVLLLHGLCLAVGLVYAFWFYRGFSLLNVYYIERGFFLFGAVVGLTIGKDLSAIKLARHEYLTLTAIAENLEYLLEHELPRAREAAATARVDDVMAFAYQIGSQVASEFEGVGRPDGRLRHPGWPDTG
jgi:hypothetical protein